MSLDDLLHQLTAPQWEARVDAVRGLAALDDERARNALGWALYDDGDDAVVQAAAELMIASGDWGHVEPLVAALENAAEHKSDVIWDVVLQSAGDPLADEVYRRCSDGSSRL